MKEKEYISTKQYRILLSFALLMIFTTRSLPAFCGACLQTIVFVLLNREIFERISNKRVCWGIFLTMSALMGEGMFFLSRFLPDSFSSSGFFLLPSSTFLFLSVPMFDYFDEEHSISVQEIWRGFFYFVPAGIFVSMIRELFGQSSVCGVYFEGLSRFRIQFFSRVSGSATLVLGSLLFLYFLKNGEEEIPYVLDTKEKRSRIFRPISLSKEKRFLRLSLCLLLYDVLFGAIGILLIFHVPAFLHQPAHIVLVSSVASLLLFTLIIKGLRQSDTLDEYNYVPFLAVITTSIPLILYMRDLVLPSDVSSGIKIVWWSALTVGIWLFSVVVIAYCRVINGRLLFGKQPRCLEGIPLIVLHVLLAMVVFMPWTEVLVNL
ncbi:MAG: hypothetical protein J5636_05085 [Clostridiales bacterium]|nr:hypothetical protein [Clostridiales bacterium]